MISKSQVKEIGSESHDRQSAEDERGCRVNGVSEIHAEERSDAPGEGQKKHSDRLEPSEIPTPNMLHHVEVKRDVNAGSGEQVNHHTETERPYFTVHEQAHGNDAGDSPHGKCSAPIKPADKPWHREAHANPEHPQNKEKDADVLRRAEAFQRHQRNNRDDNRAAQGLQGEQDRKCGHGRARQRAKP